MRPIKITLTIIGVFVFLLIWWISPARIHASLPFSGTVTDGNTGKSIEGAIVVASWELRVGGLADGRVGGYANVLESVTDRDGHFRISGWGPKVTTGGDLDSDVNP